MTTRTTALKPTIKILLYTDDPNVITDGNSFLGLGSMIERLKAHGPTFADLKIVWVSRSSDRNHHANNQLHFVLDRELEETGEPFDEIWFFGLHQANIKTFSLGAFRGGPESELNDNEVAALAKWMKIEEGFGGGVLITGDHNNPIPPNWLRNRSSHCPDDVQDPQFFGLGRAIGRCVPRAGKMRKWEGPPSKENDSVSTIPSSGFQTDRVPQKLIHEFLNTDGEPDLQGEPHPLFLYRPEDFIDVFPDHPHEGALVIPGVSNTAEWPIGPNGQPKPRIVAFGTNKRTGKRIGVVSAYDGDSAGVGRIVADSSWHHYANVNLKGFPHPAAPESPSDKIGQFYANLAIWLAPLHKRRQMAETMYWELAEYTLLLEQQRDPPNIGEIAYFLLRRLAAPCEIHELLGAFGPQQSPQKTSASGQPANLIRQDQEKLGLLLEAYHKAMLRTERDTGPLEAGELDSILNEESTGTKTASADAEPTAQTNANVVNESSEGRKEEMLVTSIADNKEWTIEMKRDSQPGEPDFVAILVFRLDSQDGVVTGQVWDGVENQFLSKVKGTYKPLPGADPWFMALEFEWGNVDVSLSGVTVEASNTVLFSGRYSTTATFKPSFKAKAGNMDNLPLKAPGDGDTGTGTGQQT
ncbi:MAG TPA: hypothetical protein VI306_10395 [Pyrinomonadaceae bacterium]